METFPKLHFGKGNEKLDALSRKFKRPVYTFSLLSGHTCPYARDCRSQVNVDMEGKRHVADGPETEFRCFSASQEALFTPVFNTRLQNMRILELAAKDQNEAIACILTQLPKQLDNGILRLHVGGDFQTQKYFDLWVAIATLRPHTLFYAYTKSLIFWIRRKDNIPSNLILTASYGGYHDRMIEENQLRYVKVVNSVYKARKLKLPIDHDDSHAVKPEGNFALLIHGLQPPGSVAGKAVRKLNGKGSYGKQSRVKQGLTR